MEQFDRVMTEITGSSENAKKALDDTNEAVLGTAYGLDVAAKGVQDFVTRGMEVDKATKTIAAWGDAVAFYGDGSNEQLASVTDALAKMSTKGTVEMDQLNRLFDVGIDAVGMYAQAVGRDASDVQDDLSAGIIKSEEFIDVVTEAMMEGTNGVTNISGAAKEAGASWSGSFANMRAAVARGVTDIIENIDEMLTSNGLPDMREMVANFGSAFEGALKQVSSLIPVVVEKIKEIKENLEPWMPLITGVVSAIAGFVTAFAIFNTLRNVILGVRTAVMLFNAALLANPIGLVIAIIGALVGVLIYLWNTNDTVREALTTAWNFIKETAIAVWQAIKDFVTPIVDELVSFIMEIWESLSVWWSDNLELMKETADTVWNAIKTAIEVVMDFLQPFLENTWKNIKLAIEIVWEAIKTVIEIAIELIQGIIKTVMQIITGDWEGAWETIKSTVESIWDSIFNFISEVGTKIWGRVKEIFDDVVNAVKERMDKTFEVVSDIGNSILDFFSNLNLFDAGRAIIQSAIDGILSIKDKIMGTVENIVDGVRSFWPFSPAKRGPLKDIDRMDFEGPITKSIGRAENPVERTVRKLAESVNDSFQFDLSEKINGLHARSQRQFSYDYQNELTVNKQPIQLNLALGNNDFEAFVEDINEVNAINAELRRF